MADKNAICVPSGDQSGRLSGPSCFTRGVTAPSATATIEMSDVPPLDGSGLTARSKAMRAPSGDQSKLPTVKSPFVRRFVFFDSTLTTHRCDRRWSASTISNSPYFLSRSRQLSLFGSATV